MILLLFQLQPWIILAFPGARVVKHFLIINPALRAGKEGLYDQALRMSRKLPPQGFEYIRTAFSVEGVEKRA
jgi:hypothetical protein